MDQNSSLAELWAATLEQMPPVNAAGSSRAFLNLSQLVDVRGSMAYVSTRDGYTKEFLETRLRPSIESAMSHQLGHIVRLVVKVDSTLDTLSPALENPDEIGTVARDATRSVPLARGIPTRASFSASEPKQPYSGRLNPRYTFESFVAGASNRFAHAAAVQVAEQPARNYNPLFIYGESGLGKTHLLHAIGHYTQDLYPGTRVRYVSSEEFTNEFINSIRDETALHFQRRYRDVDVLLVDDIQFLKGKVQTQEEFFHTFNTLHNTNKQIVITSDLAPANLHDFEDRIRTRFGSGLTTDVQPPDLETRIAILRRKTDQEGISVPADVLEYIATRISRNIRELEGALIRVTAFASLSKRPVDLTLAEEVLRNVIPNARGPEITAQLIMVEAAKFYSITLDELVGPSRSRTLVTARQVAMYLCRELTDLSLPKIGELFGGRDHTTVMHADRKIRQLMAERRSLFNSVTDLTARIRTSPSDR